MKRPDGQIEDWVRDLIVELVALDGVPTVKVPHLVNPIYILPLMLHQQHVVELIYTFLLFPTYLYFIHSQGIQVFSNLLIDMNIKRR